MFILCMLSFPCIVVLLLLFCANTRVPKHRIASAAKLRIFFVNFLFLLIESYEPCDQCPKRVRWTYVKGFFWGKRIAENIITEDSHDFMTKLINRLSSSSLSSANTGIACTSRRCRSAYFRVLIVPPPWPVQKPNTIPHRSTM